MAASSDYVFGQLSVKRAVWRQILPAIASQMVMLIYNLADTYFVGLLNDPAQTAAVTVVLPSFLMLTAISNLFGVGGASLTARFLGKQEPHHASEVTGIAFWGGMGCSVLFSFLFSLLAKPILFLCGADPAVFPIAHGYARWVIIMGAPPAILSTLLANLIRAEGRALIASCGISLGAILNIFLDPIFILPSFLGLGAEGAGMATALSNCCAVLFFLLYLICRKHSTVVRLGLPQPERIKAHLLPILSVGFPSAMQYALTVVAISAQTRFVSTYGTEAVAALGIAKKLDQLPIYFSIGVANGLLPLLSYNHAAKNHDRRREAFRFGCLISCGFSLLCLICYELFAPQLISLFIDDAQTRVYGALFLRLTVTAMPLMALCYPMIVQFQAIGRVKESLICSVLRKGVLDVPLLFLMDSLFSLSGCMLVQPIVDAVSLITALIFYRAINRSLSDRN